MNATAPPATITPSVRVASVDVYRGFVMLLMLGEVLKFCAVAAAVPASGVWAFLCHPQSHALWRGCSLHDLIQPSFSFLVGVALPFSIASRQARGQSKTRMTAHAFWRALVLILLGIFLRSLGDSQTYFTFEDTLTQIGLGYGFLFLLGFRPARDQWIALGLILVGYWAAFALYPLPSATFDYAKVGVASEWLKDNGLSGFAEHWSKNSNFAWWFDTWFMNLFPRKSPFVFNEGGYSTLSFIPTLGTMILGLLAGGVLHSERTPWRKVLWLVVAGALALASGWLLGWLGVCPVVKRIWTPSWTLLSGGWCFLILAVLYAVMDIRQFRAWAFPLMIIGINPITAYCSDWFLVPFFSDTLKRHFGTAPFMIFGPAYESLLLGGSVLLLIWLVLYWMYRKKIFIRI
jgi:heparan-alpha-glucosaminide N-acetyltransferase